MMQKIVKGLLLLLGFGAASCTEEGNGFGNTDAYGTPTTRFIVKGRVVDASGRAVPSIRVSFDDNHYGGGATISDASGNFTVTGNMFGFSIPENFSTEVVFTDTDGDDNFGSFAEKRVSVAISEADMTKQTTWSSEYSKSIGDVELELEK